MTWPRWTVSALPVTWFGLWPPVWAREGTCGLFWWGRTQWCLRSPACGTLPHSAHRWGWWGPPQSWSSSLKKEKRSKRWLWKQQITDKIPIYSMFPGHISWLSSAEAWKQVSSFSLTEASHFCLSHQVIFTSYSKMNICKMCLSPFKIKAWDYINCKGLFGGLRKFQFTHWD